MNQQTFLEKLPMRTVEAGAVTAEKEEFSRLVTLAENFINMYSLNRYTSKRMNDFTLDERLNFFKKLHEEGFYFVENELVFDVLPIETAKAALKDAFSLDGFEELDNFILESSMNGHEVLYDTYELDGEQVEMGEILFGYSLTKPGMILGDQAQFLALLEIKRAMLGATFSKLNIEKLENNDLTVYDLKYFI